MDNHKKNKRGKNLSPFFLILCTCFLGCLLFVLNLSFLSTKNNSLKDKFTEPIFAFASEITVNSVIDSIDINPGDGNCNDGRNNCTLRAAIEEANSLIGDNIINFNIPTNEGNTIFLLSPLPEINDKTGKLIINGYSQNNSIKNNISHTSFNNKIIIEINGDLVFSGKEQDLIIISSDNNEIKGLNINHCSGSCIYIKNSKNNIISGNYIGSNILGTESFDGKDSLIKIIDSDNNIIGTNGDNKNDVSERNLFATSTYGIASIYNINSNNTIISGNSFNLDYSGVASIGKAGNIVIINSNNVRIGTNGDNIFDSTERNIITSCEGLNGIEIKDSSNLVIAGNIIGLDALGETSFGNGGAGIFLDNMKVGGIRIGTNGDGVSDEIERNIISGNKSEGIYVLSSNGLIVSGNYIGTNINGTKSISNNGGILISDKSSNIVIGVNGDGSNGEKNELNLISGNKGDGISVAGNNIRVSGNIIGMDNSGLSVLSNELTGFSVGSFVDQLQIGSNLDGISDALERNIISSNKNSDGISFVASFNGADINNVNIVGNYIGVDINGEGVFGNGGSGIMVANTLALGKEIYKNIKIEKNIIANNKNNGVTIHNGMMGGASIESVYISKNSIYDNLKLGIDIGNDGVGFEDKETRDKNKVFFIEPPVITEVVGNKIEGFFDKRNISKKNKIDLYFTEGIGVEYAEGQKYLGTVEIIDGNNKWEFINDFSFDLSQGFVTALMIDSNLNTSEFSVGYQLPNIE